MQARLFWSTDKQIIDNKWSSLHKRDTKIIQKSLYEMSVMFFYKPKAINWKKRYWNSNIILQIS